MLLNDDDSAMSGMGLEPRGEDITGTRLTAQPTDAAIGVLEGLSLRERTTHAELARLDARLAGLFLAAHQFAKRLMSDETAVYLLAHAARELSRGVVHALREDDSAPSLESEDEIPDNEANRATIAAILGLAPKHPQVTSWFQHNKVFARSCHLYLDGPRPDREVLLGAFFALSEMLYGRIAPYFTTAGELDELLKVVHPTEAHVIQAEALLGRVQQRRYFFSNLEQPGWVEPLASRGHFANPPERAIYPDNSWQMRAWPEGEYLARVAAQAPQLVTDLLDVVPTSLTNPGVWGIVVDAAMALPAPMAGRLAKRVAKAMQIAPPVLFPHKAVDLIERLATDRETSAWKLAEALLWCQQTSGDAASAADEQSSDYRAKHALSRLDHYELGRFCEKALPALQRFDAERTLGLLTERLDRVLRHVYSPSGATTSEIQSSRYWCRSFEGQEANREGDARWMLAVAVARSAVTLAQAGPTAASAAWGLLQRPSGDIFERLRLYVLVHAGEHLRQELDAVVGGDFLLDRPYGSAEAAALLRAKFAQASPAARAMFRYALARGPDAEQAHGTISWYRSLRQKEEGVPPANGAGVEPVEDAPTPEEIKEAVNLWLARRLRWFHDRIPAELLDLAAEAGVQPEVPTPERQGLDEVGYYSGGGFSWVGPETPKSSEDLAAMSPEEVAAFLSSWQPEGSGNNLFSHRGLEDALSAFAGKSPVPALEVIAKASGGRLRPGYLAALVRGLQVAAEGNGFSWWADTFRAIAQVVDQDAGTHPRLPPRPEGPRHIENEWSQVVRAAAGFVQAVCAKDLAPLETSESVWRIVAALVASSLVWSGRPIDREMVGMEGVLSNALNSASGDTVRAVIDAGLWEYRGRRRVAGQQVGEELPRPEIEERVAPLLDQVLEHEGPASLAAQAMLGQFVPQLVLLAPGWLRRSEERLFAGGAQDPVAHPAWGAYIVRSRLYDRTFKALRRWYLVAATSPSAEEPEDGRPQKTREWSITQGLATHIIVAVIRGIASLGEPDALVENTFARVPAREVARTYWEIFRGWSDATEPPPEEYVRRLLAFWEWRLATLETSDQSQARNEEAEGLMWFLKTPHLPTMTALVLGRRTLNLLLPGAHGAEGVWGRLSVMAKEYPREAFELAEALINHSLTSQHAYLPFDEVAPVLSAGLGLATSTLSTRAERLIHRLGEKGLTEYGRLLSSRQRGSEALDSPESPKSSGGD